MKSEGLEKYSDSRSLNKAINLTSAYRE